MRWLHSWKYKAKNRELTLMHKLNFRRCDSIFLCNLSKKFAVDYSQSSVYLTVYFRSIVAIQCSRDNLLFYLHSGWISSMGETKIIDEKHTRLTLASLIDVLSWLSVMEGKLLKSNKHPALNNCPGKKICLFL